MRIFRGFFSANVNTTKRNMFNVIRLAFDFQNPHRDIGVGQRSFVEVEDNSLRLEYLGINSTV